MSQETFAMISRRVWVVMGLFLPIGAAAQDYTLDSSSLEEVAVTATRIPTTWNRSPVAVGLLDQDDIQLGRQQLGLDESLSNARVCWCVTMNPHS